MSGNHGRMSADKWLALSPTERQALLAQLPFGKQFLDIVRAPDGWGVCASAGPNYRGAIFGRDSLETAEDACTFDPQLCRHVILTMARLQGVKTDAQSEEEPGKIHHEYRGSMFGQVATPDMSREVRQQLQTVWGSDDQHLLYYGSFDAGPLFIRLIGQYCSANDPALLDQTYIGRDGHEHAIRDSLLAATDWLIGKITQRADRLFAYRRLNPQGLPNQAWKDSASSYIFADGSYPDFDAGIVSIELQGYAYDALHVSARLLPERRDACHALARDIQTATLAKLWLPEQRYFAQGLATDPAGTERPIDTLTSNAACLLDSQLLVDLPPDAAKPYVDGIVNSIMSDDFLTEAGIRCRAKRHSLLPGFVDYHGSHTVWPKETYDIAKGLRRFGFHAEARELMQRFVGAIQKAGDFCEFFYANPDGSIWYDVSAGLQEFAKLSAGHDLPTPQPGQAWTIAAAIAASHELAHQPK